MEEIKAQEEAFTSQVFSLVKSLAQHKNGGEMSSIRKLIPSADSVITEYSKFFSQYKFDAGSTLNQVLKDRLANFQKTHIRSLQLFYEKSFNHLNKVIDSMNDHAKDLQNSYAQALSDHQNELNRLKEQKQRELDKLIEEADQEHQKKVEELKNEIQITTETSQSRINEESKRIVEHFEKQLAAKSEAHQMAITAIDKAKTELDEAIKQRRAELEVIRTENDKLLAEHANKLGAKTREIDMKVEVVEKELNELRRQQSELGPELERTWQARSRELTREFEEEDKRLTAEINEKNDSISKLQQEIAETKDAIDKHRLDAEGIKKQQLADLEAQLQKVIDEREPTLTAAHEEHVSKLESKLHRLEENLETAKEGLERDKREFKEKMEDKAKRRQEHLDEIEKKHTEEANRIQSEIDRIKQETEKTKADWSQQIKEIEESYQRDLEDITSKENKEDKYFEAKMKALQMELDRVLMENQAIAASIPNYEEDKKAIEEAKLSLQDAEQQFSSKVTQEMERKIEERVNERMKEIRNKHLEERSALLSEARRLEEHEAALNNQIIEHNRQLAECKKKSCAMFASSAYIDASIDKWREDYFIETKNLKQEEAAALQHLDNCKVEFKEAVNKTVTLRTQLKETTERYEKEISAIKEKGADELDTLKNVVDAKEREIMDLERKFDENEREVRKRVRQIETAEDQLSHLRIQLTEEKTKIKEVIRKEYQPLIHNERRKTELMVSEIERLRNELQLNVEYMKQDLYDVETANAALEESLSQETAKLVNELKEQLEEECRLKEEEAMAEMSSQEMVRLEEVNHEIAAFSQEVEDLKVAKQKQIEEEQEQYKQQITKLNDECITILTENSEKKEKIKYLENLECKTCPILEKNLKKLEKVLVKMQLQDRDLALDGQNKKEMIRALKGKQKLPPLPAQPL